MSRAKGRDKRGRLPDLSIRPTEPERYAPPPVDEEYAYHQDFGGGVRMHLRQGLCQGRLVEFAITLDLLAEQCWLKVCRIDSAHGEIHIHQYFAAAGVAEDRRVLQVVAQANGVSVIDRWFDRASAMMENDWRSYLGRWRGERD